VPVSFRANGNANGNGNGNGNGIKGKVRVRKYVVAGPGARMHYAIPRMLNEAGMLAHFYTDICANVGWPRFAGLIPESRRPLPLRRLLGRLPEGIPVDRITTFPGFALQYWGRERRSRSVAETNEVYLWAGRRFCSLVARRGFKNATGVYVFESAGLEILKEAKRLGLSTVTEQSIAPREITFRILGEECHRFPGWETPIPTDAALSVLIDREREEWSLSDVILCGSEFVAAGIGECGGPRSRAIVVPYGVDARFAAAASRVRRGAQLRVLTVGEVGLRKGSQYVLEAAKKLGPAAEFRMVGQSRLPEEPLRLLSRHVQLLGPIPRAEMQKQYEWADVFLLPSLCEGSATVTYEALSAGLPVICTFNTGSVVTDGVEGYIVPIRDADAIVEKLLQLANQAALLSEISGNAMARAKQFSLSAYRNRLLSAIP
jgi:glycosyltransferase involved in cell wall biosynthesis